MTDDSLSSQHCSRISEEVVVNVHFHVPGFSAHIRPRAGFTDFVCAARVPVYFFCPNPARYVEQLETLKSQEKTITRNAQVVEQMYALLAQYDVKAPSEDMVQVDDLRTIQVRRSAR